MKTLMVRYKTAGKRTPKENARLVHAVFDELRARPARRKGIRYATYRLADGVTFVPPRDARRGSEPAHLAAGLQGLSGEDQRALRRAAGSDGADHRRLVRLSRRCPEPARREQRERPRQRRQTLGAEDSARYRQLPSL